MADEVEREVERKALAVLVAIRELCANGGMEWVRFGPDLAASSTAVRMVVSQLDLDIPAATGEEFVAGLHEMFVEGRGLEVKDGGGSS